MDIAEVRNALLSEPKGRVEPSDLEWTSDLHDHWHSPLPINIGKVDEDMIVIVELMQVDYTIQY